MNIQFDKLEKISNDEFVKLSKKARELSWEHHSRKLKVYYPNALFPTISITGTLCAQNCLYCNKKYLEQMHPIASPKELLSFAQKLSEKGGKGILISGGYTEQFTLPIEPYLDVIRKIKEKTELLINLHPGLVDKEQAKAIFDANIDAVSFDLIIDNQVIEKFIGNKYSGKDYLESYLALQSVGLQVIPHICLGLFFGEKKGNIEAINIALEHKPNLVVFLGLIPTKNTLLEKAKVIEPLLLAKMLLYARINFPYVEEALGCMRVRKYEYEKLAVDVGINRIATPKVKSLDYIQRNYNLKIEKIESCCAL